MRQPRRFDPTGPAQESALTTGISQRKAQPEIQRITENPQKIWAVLPAFVYYPLSPATLRASLCSLWCSKFRNAPPKPAKQARRLVMFAAAIFEVTGISCFEIFSGRVTRIRWWHDPTAAHLFRVVLAGRAHPHSSLLRGFLFLRAEFFCGFPHPPLLPLFNRSCRIAHRRVFAGWLSRSSIEFHFPLKPQKRGGDDMRKSIVFSRVSSHGLVLVFPFVPPAKQRSAMARIWLSSENNFPLTGSSALHTSCTFPDRSARGRISSAYWVRIWELFIQSGPLC